MMTRICVGWIADSRLRIRPLCDDRVEPLIEAAEMHKCGTARLIEAISKHLHRLRCHLMIQRYFLRMTLLNARYRLIVEAVKFRYRIAGFLICLSGQSNQ